MAQNSGDRAGGGPSSPHLLVEVEDGVAIITLNRPEVMNAFSSTMGDALASAYRTCDEDDAVRAVVLTGAGAAFCAGADFSKGAGVFGSPSGKTDFRSDPFDFHAWDVRKPVIAAMNGHAIGLGLTMALQCDMRIMARQAKYGIVQNRRGVLPDLRSHWTLPRLVGHARATDLLLTGRTFTGADALEWGIATQVLDGPDVLPAAVELAHDIATNTAPLSVGLSKAILWRGEPMSSDEIDDLERRLHLHLMGRADAREGVQAFIEKREPEWSLSVTRDWPSDTPF